MDEKHQDKAGGNLITTEDKLWHPPLSLKEQERLDRLQKRRTKANKKRFFEIWATPLSILIAAATLLWSVYQFNVQQQQTRQQEAASGVDLLA